MKKYLVYTEDDINDNFYKFAVPAETEREAETFVEGNGEIVDIKEYTGSMVSIDELANILRGKISDIECDFILRTLTATGICE